VRSKEAEDDALRTRRSVIQVMVTRKPCWTGSHSNPHQQNGKEVEEAVASGTEVEGASAWRGG